MNMQLPQINSNFHEKPYYHKSKEFFFKRQKNELYRTRRIHYNNNATVVRSEIKRNGTASSIKKRFE